MDGDANRPIKALLTMDDIVSALEREGATSVTDLSDTIDRPQSVVHDYLSTLQQLGYVIQTDGGAYALSLRYLELGGRVRDDVSLYGVAKPEVNRLAESSSSELVTLSVEQNGLCVALDVVQSERNVAYDFSEGTHFHMHSSGVGKAMLAQYDDERVTAILDRHGMPARTENSITDRDRLDAELERIREAGVAFDREEYRTGMTTISTTIEDAAGVVLGGLSVTGPAHRLAESDVQEELRSELLSTVNIIELNYSAR
ncbi:transcriptional regulator, IclR family protein [Halosimplex carlsbadense 2-9-1]|uniref:Transcriptional regulator, IclR family protein n=1 Tax=Halosimplex carlsbadense 2-9-1 TaxID=797114 RepID=M0CC06_9EURY|nr:IclR family transcriptional regulator [Halosimplex carlsbadense]ELZ19882.1 transcriptional regulator, IclR family protein [Halosimplex carlsbadense 2-9-1]